MSRLLRLFAAKLGAFPSVFLLILLPSLASAQGNPADVGLWGALIPAELVPIHVILLPNGKLMYWDRHDQGTHDMIPRVWDPAANTTIKAPDPGYDLFCAGHTFLRNGDVVIGGGHISDFVGENRMRIYNWRTNTWDVNLPTLNSGRWYPTNTALPNGDVLMLSGDILKDKPNEIPQIYEYRTRTLRTLDSAKLKITWYPFTYIAGRERVFMAGPDSMTQFLDTRGRGKWTQLGFTKSKVWRDYGSSVMYLPGKVMISGGAGYPPQRSAEIVDINAPAPAWNFTDSMAFARRHHTSVIMPDGKVIVVGGTSARGFNNGGGAVFNAEAWDPATGKWATWAPAKTMRIYHSFALLLPDARILTGGGGHPGDEANSQEAHPDFEIFEPPYLFKGARPVITSAPDTVYYGRPFTVTSATPGNVQVNLLRYAAVTHAFDQSQNFNRLAVQRVNATTLTVTAPADSVLTPPGPHHLFLLDAAGIPSVSKLVWVTTVPGGIGVVWRDRGRRGIGLLVDKDLVRIPDADAARPGKALLFDLGGKLAADLSPVPGQGFRLPAGLADGIYQVRAETGGRTITGSFCKCAR